MFNAKLQRNKDTELQRYRTGILSTWLEMCITFGGRQGILRWPKQSITRTLFLHSSSPRAEVERGRCNIHSKTDDMEMVIIWRGRRSKWILAVTWSVLEKKSERTCTRMILISVSGLKLLPNHLNFRQMLRMTPGVLQQFGGKILKLCKPACPCLQGDQWPN